MSKLQKKHFFRFGLIESRSGWIDGYCEVTETGYLFPPTGKREAQKESKAAFHKAVFHESEHIAREAMKSP